MTAADKTTTSAPRPSEARSGESITGFYPDARTGRVGHATHRARGRPSLMRSGPEIAIRMLRNWLGWGRHDPVESRIVPAGTVGVFVASPPRSHLGARITLRKTIKRAARTNTKPYYGNDMTKRRSRRRPRTVLPRRRDQRSRMPRFTKPSLCTSETRLPRARGERQRCARRELQHRRPSPRCPSGHAG